MFRLMLPVSYGQSALYMLVLMESPLRLFIVRGYSSCLGEVPQSNSLKENSLNSNFSSLQFSLPQTLLVPLSLM